MVTNAERTDAAIFRGRLMIIAVAGLLLRLALWWFNHDAPPQVGDAQDYDGIATRLVERGEFVSQSGRPTSIRPPLYPAFVASIYRLAGVHNYAAVYAIQSLLNLATTWLVYRLGSAAYDRRVGAYAAVIFGFYPTFLAYEHLLLTEVLGTFLLTAATLALVLGRARTDWRLAAAAGVLFGLAALTRSATLLLMPFLAVWILFSWPESLGRRFVTATVVIAAFAAVIAPWSYRNTRVQGTFTMIDVMGGRNAMMGNYEHTPLERSWATIDIVEEDRAWIRTLHDAYPQEFQRGHSQSEIDKLAMRYALNYMREHPGQTLRRSLVKFGNFWQLEREVVAEAERGFFGLTGRTAIAASALVICGYYAACLFAAVFGAVLKPPSDLALQLLILLCIAVPCAAHTLIFAHSRYHLPLVPLLAVYAAAAISDRRLILSQASSYRFLGATALCVALLGGWIRELLAVDLHHLL